MLDGDLLALRPGRSDDVAATIAPQLGAAPDAMAIPSPRPRGRRAVRHGTSAAVAILCHVGLAVLFVPLWHSMVRDVSVPEAITVELVDRIPGEPKKPEPKAEAERPPPQLAAEPPAPPPVPPPPVAPSEPVPAPAPAEPSVLDQALKGHLAEPPPEARAAESQDKVNQAGTASTAPVKDSAGRSGTPQASTQPDAPATPPAAPAVMAAAGGEASVPAPSTAPEHSKPSTSGALPSLAQRAVDLAAALPMSGLPMPSTFRAALSAMGTSDNAEYRGSVFGALSRARQAVNDEARAKRLKGQVVLAIVLTPTGDIDKASIIQSSGSAAADAFALDMVRHAAPFPPPPPGASRTFTPAVTFGGG